MNFWIEDHGELESQKEAVSDISEHLMLISLQETESRGLAGTACCSPHI